MSFRPCIDIHNGKVKQIIGSSLTDEGAIENYISNHNSAYYAKLFKEDNLKGGHIIRLSRDIETEKEAISALEAYPNGMQIGGGITDENCCFYLDKGASHIIVTSFIFRDGIIDYRNLNKLVNTCGKERIVLDLSCIEKNNKYFIATNRWAKITSTYLNEESLNNLSSYCQEFLVHAVSKEGKSSGIDENLLKILAKSPIKTTYAGGISSYNDIYRIKEIGNNNIDYTIGSSLDIFGGHLEYDKVKKT